MEDTLTMSCPGNLQRMLIIDGAGANVVTDSASMLPPDLVQALNTGDVSFDFITNPTSHRRIRSSPALLESYGDYVRRPLWLPFGACELYTTSPEESSEGNSGYFALDVSGMLVRRGVRFPATYREKLHISTATCCPMSMNKYDYCWSGLATRQDDHLFRNLAGDH